MRSACAATFALILVSLYPARAGADEPNHAQAVAAFQDGRQKVDRGDVDGAITKFRESIALEPSIGARLSLADCLESRDPVAAWRLFKEAAAQALVNRDDRVSVAEQRAALIEKRVATIRVFVPQSALDLPNFELRVDGELLDRYVYKGQMIAAKPGRHLVEASAPGRHWSQEATADVGNPTAITVRLQADTCTVAPVAPVAPQPQVVHEEARGSTRRLLGLVIGGVGLAGVVNGAIFGAITLTKKSDINSLCGGNSGACQAPTGSVDVEREAAKTTAAVSTASFIAGGALLLGGGVLFFTAPSGTTGSVGVAPSVAQNGGGLTVRGLW
ncbi:MAG TPA: hypothetical protein VIF62_10835 [Labilithrix sp.]|jgi:hypothetical protein